MLGSDCNPCCVTDRVVGIGAKDFGPTMNGWNFLGGTTLSSKLATPDGSEITINVMGFSDSPRIVLGLTIEGGDVRLIAQMFADANGMRKWADLEYRKPLSDYTDDLASGRVVFTTAEAVSVQPFYDANTGQPFKVTPPLSGGAIWPTPSLSELNPVVVPWVPDLADAGNFAFLVDVPRGHESPAPELQFLGKSYRVTFNTAASQRSILGSNFCTTSCKPMPSMPAEVQCPGGDPEESRGFPEEVKGIPFEFEMGSSGHCISRVGGQWSSFGKDLRSGVALAVPRPRQYTASNFLLGVGVKRRNFYYRKSGGFLTDDSKIPRTCSESYSSTTGPVNKCATASDPGLYHAPLFVGVNLWLLTDDWIPGVQVHERCFLAFAENGVFQSGRYSGMDVFYRNPGPCGTTGSLDYNTWLWNPMSFTIEQFDGPAKQYGLLTLSFTACHGNHATGTAQAAQFGPITGVTLTAPGQGYAKLGRRQPTLSIVGANATFTFTQGSGMCDLPYWSVASVTVASGATGFADYQDVAIVADAGDVVEVPATGTIRTRRGAPTLTASATPGNGATFSVTLANNGDDTWGVQSVAVTGNTSSYQDGTLLTFTGGTEQAAAYARIVTGRIEPTVSVSASGSGAGAVLTPTLTSGFNWEGKVVWSVSSISITDGGTGYAVGDYITATPTDGQADYYSYFFAEVTGVNEAGAITGIAIYDGGGFFKSDGTILEVVVDYSGQYYLEEIDSISISNGGRYYREDPTLPPIVAPVTVGVVQPAGAFGSGAVITATVNADTSSPQFGQIAALTLVAGGTNYTDWKYTGACDTNPFP